MLLEDCLYLLTHLLPLGSDADVGGQLRECLFETWRQCLISHQCVVQDHDVLRRVQPRLQSSSW